MQSAKTQQPSTAATAISHVGGVTGLAIGAKLPSVVAEDDWEGRLGDGAIEASLREMTKIKVVDQPSKYAHLAVKKEIG
jgi:hypothetical protein